MPTVEDYMAIAGAELPFASPDGRRIALKRAGEARRFEDGDLQGLPVEVPGDSVQSQFLWGPDGDRLFVRVGSDARSATIDEVRLGSRGEDGSVRTVVEREGQSLPWDVTPGGDALYYLQEGEDWTLRRVGLETGADEHLLTYPRMVHLGAAGLSPDGERLVQTVGEPGAVGNTTVRLGDADGSDLEPLGIGDPEARTIAVAWSPEGDRLLVNEGPSYMDTRVGVYDIDADATEWLTPGDGGERGIAFLPDGGVLALRDDGGGDVSNGGSGGATPVVYRDGEEERFEVAGGIRIPPTVGDGVLTEGGILLTRITATRPWEVVELDLETGRVETLVGADFGAVDPDSIVEPERVTYRSSDGETLDGLLFDPGVRPAPAVTVVYGATTELNGWFRPEFQLLRERGYAVFVPQTREDTYHGVADFADGVRWLRDRDWVDEDRIAVYGHSHGGYDVLMLLAEYPDLFAAGVEHNGVTDLPALAEAGDDVPNIRRQLGPYEENRETWRERSPIERVESVQSPLLLLHGETDWVVPASQGRRYRDALEDRGWTEGEEFEYVEREEGHASTDPTDSAATWADVLDFLERRL